MEEKLLDGQACAILSLTTRICWSEDLPQPFSRPMAWRMIESGALQGLVLREVPGIDMQWLQRAQALLGRIGAVYECIEAYKKAGYSLLLPGRANWPRALGVLGTQTPLFLFAKGNLKMLNARRIAVAGSRAILRETKNAAACTGRLIAQEGMTLVSGGAVGVDRAAQCGALEAGGNVVIVPAMTDAQVLAQKNISEALKQGRLLLLCDTLPDEPFSAQKALMRNHTIYALGEAGLVVAAREGAGGSWRGATDCLRGGWRPVYVWDGDNADTAGNRALCTLGARGYSLEKRLSDQITGCEQVSLFGQAGGTRCV